MKMNSLNFVLSWFNTLIVALAIVVAPAITIAKAQHSAIIFEGLSIPNNVTTGLFTPTQSQKFFQTGREDFEREIAIFTFPERYSKDKLLQFDPELIEQLNLLGLSNNFGSENDELKLNLESIFIYD